jgi:hypothetical protein
VNLLGNMAGPQRLDLFGATGRSADVHTAHRATLA